MDPEMVDISRTNESTEELTPLELRVRLPRLVAAWNFAWLCPPPEFGPEAGGVLGWVFWGWGGAAPRGIWLAGGALAMIWALKLVLDEVSLGAAC